MHCKCACFLPYNFIILGCVSFEQRRTGDSLRPTCTGVTHLSSIPLAMVASCSISSFKTYPVVPVPNSAQKVPIRHKSGYMVPVPVPIRHQVPVAVPVPVRVNRHFWCRCQFGTKYAGAGAGAGQSQSALYVPVPIRQQRCRCRCRCR